MVNDQKKKRQRDENIWTWDDWLVEVRTKLANSNTNSDDVPATLSEKAVGPTSRDSPKKLGESSNPMAYR